jgi:hypothetical protein
MTIKQFMRRYGDWSITRLSPPPRENAMLQLLMGSGIEVTGVYLNSLWCINGQASLYSPLLWRYARKQRKAKCDQHNNNPP